MGTTGRRTGGLLALVVFAALLFPAPARPAATPTMVIEEARFAIEQARRAGAEQAASEDYAAARRWLSQAEREYDKRKSLFSRSSKAKDEEILYLGTMSKLKALSAEARSKTKGVSIRLAESRRELSDYRDALDILRKKSEEVAKAREVQARAEEERRSLEETRKQAAELEERKRRDLEEAQRRAGELQELRRKELEASRLEEAERLSKKEKDLAEAAVRQAKEAERIAALQRKAEAFEKDKALLDEAGKIPRAAVKIGEGEIVITVLAVNLFAPGMELTASGRETLDGVAAVLSRHPGRKAAVRGHTDNIGSEAANKTVSENRARKVRDYLVESQNLAPDRITAAGMGPSQPAASNDTEAGRALNRRVEIAVSLE